MYGIPRFPEAPPLTPQQIEELTEIVFLKPTPPRPCDLIFVFGGSHPGLWKYAARAYRDRLGQIILATGGSVRPEQRHPTWTYGDTPEAQIITRKLVELGVPVAAILHEERSSNSLENVLCAQEVLDFGKLKSILFVCKCYGAGRQYRTLKHNIPAHIELCPYPFDTEVANGTLVRRDTWMDHELGRSFVFGAYLRILYYGRRGDILPLESPVAGLEAHMQRYLPPLEC